MSFSTIYVPNLIGKRRGVIMNYIKWLCFNANKHVCWRVSNCFYLCLHCVNVLLKLTAICMDWESIGMRANVEAYKMN